MLALSLWQPWASLLVLGEKRVETRSWRPRQTLPLRLAVHASRAFPPEARDLCGREPFRSALARHGLRSPDALPLGCLLGTVELYAVVPAEELLPALGDAERAFGLYAPGRVGWLCARPTPLVVPVPFPGKQGFFVAPDEVLS